MTRPKVVILGAGFAGLWAARGLARCPVDVLVIDRNNYHTFLPLLYQVSAAEVEPEQIVYPVRSILSKAANVNFALGEVTEVDLEARVVRTVDREIPYDYLIATTGSASNYFGIPGAAEHSFPLKTLEEAAGLRNQILCRFERAAQISDPDIRRRVLTFAVVGGGPTGVEFAGALSELVRRPLAKDYPNIHVHEVRIVLVEALGNLLSALPKYLGDYAAARLHDKGVEVMLNAAVDEIAPDVVHLKDGTSIPTETVIWTAGVQGDPNAKVWGLPVARGGRVKVLPTLQAEDHPEVYVAGDLAYFEQDGTPLPMLAPVATQQGTHAARNIVRQIRGKALKSFRYVDRGTMATVGRNAAVAYLNGRALTGFPAWLLWVIVHIYNLIGFRNRIFVLINWAWDYFFFEKSVRLIFPQCPRPLSCGTTCPEEHTH